MFIYTNLIFYSYLICSLAYFLQLFSSSDAVHGIFIKHSGRQNIMEYRDDFRTFNAVKSFPLIVLVFYKKLALGSVENSFCASRLPFQILLRSHFANIK